MTQVKTTAYSTTDIYLSASLIASGFKLSNMTKNERQYIFYFDSSDSIEIYVNKYWNGDMILDAKTIFTAFKELKSRMYNQNI